MTSVKEHIAQSQTLLYLGAGRAESDHIGIRDSLFSIPCKIAMEIYKPSAETWLTEPEWVPMLWDIQDLSMFLDKSFDMIAVLDVIEHLERDAGLKLLDEIDRLCKRVCVIWVPEGFLDVRKYQAEYLGDNDYLLHLSGWSRADFIDAGYRVHVHYNYFDFGDAWFNGLLCFKVFEGVELCSYLR